jgi:hypothetical protein
MSPPQYCTHPAPTDCTRPALPGLGGHRPGHCCESAGALDRRPGLPDLAALVKEVPANSAEFARLWSRYDLRYRRREAKPSTIPGSVTSPSALRFWTSTTDFVSAFLQAEPGTADHDALKLLALARTSRNSARPPSARNAQLETWKRETSRNRSEPPGTASSQRAAIGESDV